MTDRAATERALEAAAAGATRFLRGLAERPVGATAGAEELRARLGGPLPDGPTDPAEVVAQLAELADDGVVASAGPRFFGFVVGGSLPAALAADWLAAAWDQNAGLFVLGPAAATVEDVAAGWLTDLLGLPPTVSTGFVTGGQMASFTGLAAARHHVLAAAGWDVERDGLIGAPPVEVVVGAERHVTLDAALRFLGLGSGRLRVVPADGQGRMDAAALPEALAALKGPTIVCAQAGNVNTGAVDPLPAICAAAHDHGAWVHVDGAFGLWAAASPALRHLVAGVGEADSVATDAHKWLNVPYDSGLVFVAHPEAHRAAFATVAGYLTPGQADERDPDAYTAEFSRRARGFPIWAALRSLGRAGVAAMVERGCAQARRFAAALEAAEGVEVLNEVVLNQVLVRFRDPDGDHDGRTREVVRRVQSGGTLWLSGTTWHDMAAMRISVSNWSTTDDDVDRSVAAILEATKEVDG
ncbi:MAG TPA: aminotransferase class V-fold PLP-dependent enzyme [Actinomycetota bacterium]|nr:aminotransferase class V-fold PLP-dependent enzyme [Actinomycetota bacterium]